MAEILHCLCFHGLIHPNKKRLVGGYVGKWEADDRVGGEKEKMNHKFDAK